MSVSPAQLLAQIEAALRPLADPLQAQPMRAYMLGQFDFLGVRAGPRRQALRDLPKPDWSMAEWATLTQALWALPEREFQYVAVDLLARWHRQLTPQALPVLWWLIERKSWWDSVDGLAGVVGDILHPLRTEPEQAETEMLGCLKHDCLWMRRTAMLHQLGWGERTDEARLFRHALALAPEKDFFIRKAIGWALRDHARTRPEAVRRFLRLQGQALSALSRREAAKHL